MRSRGLSDMKKITAMKNFRYNRFLLLRYLLATFFFANLYWALALIMSRSLFAALPAGLIILMIPAISEHLRLYGYLSDDIQGRLQFHLIYQKLQMGINGFLIILVFMNSIFEELFPFFVNTTNARAATVFILLIGILISGIIIKRINKIYQQKDRHYHYIKEFSKTKE